MTVEKLERDGMIAILYSPGYGAGWSTWNRDYEQILFDPEIVVAVEAGDLDLAREIAQGKYEHGYFGGARDLKVRWLAKGTLFRINEYDGLESVEVLSFDNFMIA
jgi:hypothetical protein